MEWVCEFNSTTPDGKRLEYRTLKQAHTSRAERKDQVRIGSRAVHIGYVSDGKGYKAFRNLSGGTPALIRCRCGHEHWYTRVHPYCPECGR